MPVPVFLAEFNPIAIIVIGVIWSLISAAAKKKPRPPGELLPPGQGQQRAGGLMGELGRALEELKRAEAEARGLQLPASEQLPPRVPETMPEQKARAYLAEQKARGEVRTAGARHTDAQVVKRQVFVPKPRQAPKRPSVRVPVEDDMSSEDPSVTSMEGRDYDNEAEKIILARRQRADRGVRRDSSSEELSALQIARRADRTPRAIGGKVQHEDWHQRRDAALTAEAAELRAASAKGANPLARYATGRVRDAIVLSEILGKPVSER